jgi:L-asparaginase II
MSAVLVEVCRGGVVECRHRGAIAVSDAEGRLVASAGDPALMTYFRSAAKPLQALPVVAGGAADAFAFTDEELAVCCASHNGEPAHQLVVTGLLAKLGLDQAALRCGTVPPIDRATAARVNAGLLAPTPLHCDCSGKHSGMLAACAHHGWPLDSYKEPDHPHQREILQTLRLFLGTPDAEIPIAIDGCGVPTFYLSVAAIARAWAGLVTPPEPYGEAARRVLDAMAAAPYMVAGRGRICTDLMNLLAPAVVVKSGAEGVFCLALRERGLGVAIKIEDGNGRGFPVIVASLLTQLGVMDAETADRFLGLQSPQLRNHTGTLVGELRAAFTLN